MEQYYNELLARAVVEYGMTPYQFWHEDVGLFDAYQAAHYRKMHDTAFLHGAYINIALQAQLSNMLLKKGSKPAEYIKEPMYPEFIKQNNPKAKDEESAYRATVSAWM